MSLHILHIYDTELIHLLNLRRYALYYANKGLLDGDIESSIVFNFEEINQHKEGHNATIIYLYSLPVVWFSLLDVRSYNFAAYIPRRMYIIEEQTHSWTTPFWMTMTIRLSPMPFHTSGF